jgi:predicted PurR-regulated permease PerM
MGAHFIKQTALIFSLLLLLFLIWLARHVLLLAFSGLLLALALTSLVNFTCRWLPLSHRWALAVVFLCSLGLMTLGAWLLVPALSGQFATLAETLPKQVEQLTRKAENSDWYRSLSRIIPEPESLLSTGADAAGSDLSKVFTSTADAISGIVLILFIAIFLAAKPMLYKRGLLSLVPPRRRKRGKEILDRAICALKYWLLGQFIAMVAVGTFVGVSLALAGIPLAGAMGIVAGTLEFIPFLGPILAAIPAILLAASVSAQKVYVVIAIFCTVQFIEGYLLTPLVQHKTVDLPPVITLLAVILFGTTFGVIGVLVATPLAALTMVLVQEIYIKDVLGNQARKVG